MPLDHKSSSREYLVNEFEQIDEELPSMRAIIELICLTQKIGPLLLMEWSQLSICT
jgi:hypothetical protein